MQVLIEVFTQTLIRFGSTHIRDGHSFPYSTSPSMTVAVTLVPKISSIGTVMILRSRTTKSAFFPIESEPRISSEKDAYAVSSVIPLSASARVRRSDGYLGSG